MDHNNSGFGNTAVGVNALVSNTAGVQNTAVGQGALASNTSGVENTAIGLQALATNATGDGNTVSGWHALFLNETGNGNTAIGVETLGSNVTGGGNTAIGLLALSSNETGFYNTAVGYRALLFNTTGSANTAIGQDAGLSIGTGSNNVDIANPGVFGESNTIRIGSNHTRTFIAGIHGVNEGGTGIAAAYINSAGRLGTTPPPSSRWYKNDIKPMDKASEAILGLKPVTFHYKSDNTGTPQFGLIAEEVAKVNPDLVVRDEIGEIYTVRYDAVNAMLLNEFLKEHRKMEEQGAIIAQQQKQIEALTAGLQKVNDQLELSKRAPQTVSNQ
jgi:hypothetical protein